MSRGLAVDGTQEAEAASGRHGPQNDSPEPLAFYFRVSAGPQTARWIGCVMHEPFRRIFRISSGVGFQWDEEYVSLWAKACAALSKVDILSDTVSFHLFDVSPHYCHGFSIPQAAVMMVDQFIFKCLVMGKFPSCCPRSTYLFCKRAGRMNLSQTTSA